MNSITAADLAALSNAELRKFAYGLASLQVVYLRLPEHDPRLRRTDELERLVSAELARRANTDEPVYL